MIEPESATGFDPVASFPMYDWTELRWAHDALWTAVREELQVCGFDAPEHLTRAERPEMHWLDPALLVSQTCGWPFATRLRGHVRLVASPLYSVEGCDGPLYSSMVVVRKSENGSRISDFRGRTVARNSHDSLSGSVALVAAMREHGLDAANVNWVETGAHRASVRAVADGEADLAAIDAVCWRMAQEHDSSSTAKLRVIERTPFRPALPFITSGLRTETGTAAIRSALAAAIAREDARSAVGALHLAGVTAPDERAYREIAGLLDGSDDSQRREPSRASNG